MAEINNGLHGPARLAVRIEICEHVPPGDGMVSVGPTALNAALGVFRVHVSFQLGGEEVCGHELLLHESAIRGWTSRVKALVTGERDRDVLHEPVESPELILTVWRHRGASGDPTDARYELLVALDTGVFEPESGLSGEGPGVFLSPDPAELLQFADELLAEAERAQYRG
jgi:hypothetical protein